MKKLNYLESQKLEIISYSKLKLLTSRAFKNFAKRHTHEVLFHYKIRCKVSCFRVLFTDMYIVWISDWRWNKVPRWISKKQHWKSPVKLRLFFFLQKKKIKIDITIDLKADWDFIVFFKDSNFPLIVSKTMFIKEKEGYMQQIFQETKGSFL